MNDVTIIIIGMTGDLAKRKILPALYELFYENMLAQFVIIGAAPEHIERGALLNDVKEFIPKLDAHRWQEFIGHCFYIPVDAHDSETFVQLKDFIEGKRSCIFFER